MYYVYILESLSNGDYYKGSTENYLKRLEETIAEKVSTREVNALGN